MITCHITYQIDANKTAEFEIYAKAWIELVAKFGGQHHGYFLPKEGPNDLAFAAFSFPSLADYEVYRTKSAEDADCLMAFEYAQKTGCIVRYDRYFLRPVLDGSMDDLRAES